MGLKFERGYLLTKSVHIQVGRVLCFSDNSRARCPGIVYGFLEEYSPLYVCARVCVRACLCVSVSWILKFLIRFKKSPSWTSIFKSQA